MQPNDETWAFFSAAARSGGSAQACSILANCAGHKNVSLAIPFCFGASGCPWCMLGIAESEHGDYRKLGERIMGMRTSSALSENSAHPEEMQGMMSGLFQSLAAACVKHAELAFPTQDHMHAKQKLATLGILDGDSKAPQSVVKVGCTSDAFPPPPGISAIVAPIPSQPVTSKASAEQMWAMPGQECLWLTEKLVVAPTRVRGVKIATDASGLQWTYLNKADAQKIMQWYDRANLYDVLKGATVDPATGLLLDFRWEGATAVPGYVTMAPGGPIRREAHVTYMPRDRSG
jgi:hypothetical protein